MECELWKSEVDPLVKQVGQLKLLRKYGMYEEELSVINAGLLNIPKNNGHRDELFERKKKVHELIRKNK